MDPASIRGLWECPACHSQTDEVRCPVCDTPYANKIDADNIKLLIRVIVIGSAALLGVLLLWAIFKNLEFR